MIVLTSREGYEIFLRESDIEAVCQLPEYTYIRMTSGHCHHVMQLAGVVNSMLSEFENKMILREKGGMD